MTSLTFDIYIRATPDTIWRALIDPAITPRYRWGSALKSLLETGEPLSYGAGT